MDPKPQTDVDQIGDDLYDQMLAEESDYVREYNDVISYISNICKQIMNKQR